MRFRRVNADGQSDQQAPPRRKETAQRRGLDGNRGREHQDGPQDVDPLVASSPGQRRLESQAENRGSEDSEQLGVADEQAPDPGEQQHNLPHLVTMKASEMVQSSLSEHAALRSRHAHGRRRLDGQRVLVEQCGELLRREDPVALGHELTNLLPVRVVGEHDHDAISASS
jgi:hypothetical protein